MRCNEFWWIVFVLCLTACGTSNAPARVVVEWTTATEINTAGFNLYRGESAEGPSAKINSELIPASPDPLLGGKYRYEDATVVAGRTYYYQLEDVEYSGARARHGPIIVTAPSELGAMEIGAVALSAGALGALVWVAIHFARTRKNQVEQ